jgi:tRNA pseudouridine38-40 synthase
MSSVEQPQTVRLRLTVAYDGTPFHGVAENEGVATVGGALRKSLERILGHPVVLAVAGRTDTGVHAWGQVVTFDADAARLDIDALPRALNALCRPSIVVRDAAIVGPEFHARFSATARVYRYHIFNEPFPNPFVQTTSWHVPQPLDLAAMRNAAVPFVGTHDFSTFCKREKVERADGTVPSLVREVRRAEWSRVDDRMSDGMLAFEIEASSFCRQMVRSIVGTLVDVGLGKRRAGDVPAMLRARDRTMAGQVAPPEGLVLWEVKY